MKVNIPFPLHRCAAEAAEAASRDAVLKISTEDVTEGIDALCCG